MYISQEVSVKGICHSPNTMREEFDFARWKEADTGRLAPSRRRGPMPSYPEGGKQTCRQPLGGDQWPPLRSLSWQVLALAERMGDREAKLAAAERRSHPGPRRSPPP